MNLLVVGKKTQDSYLLLYKTRLAQKHKQE